MTPDTWATAFKDLIKLIIDIIVDVIEIIADSAEDL